MEGVVLFPLKFSSCSFLKRQITAKGKFSSGVAPCQNVARSLPRVCAQASDRYSPRALSRADSFDSAVDTLISEGNLEVAIDPGMFEEVFPTLRKQEARPGRQRSSKAALGDSTTKSILIPDEWVPIQKHHLRTKKERKQEVLALQVQRAREREEEERAVREEAALEVQARLFSSLYINSEVSRSSFAGRREEWKISADEGEGTGTDGDADDAWEEAEGEEEEFLAVFASEAAAGTVSRRARPKDHRTGLEFSSLEEVAERLRQVAETEPSSRSSDRGSTENVEDEQPQIVQLTPEEKAMLKNRNLNFAAVSSRSWSPLHTLAAAGQVYLAAELLKRGAQVDALDKEGFTPIHRAIQSGRKMMVRLLLKAGANPRFRDKDGATLLHYAAQTGNHEIAKLLLRDDVDVNTADKDGWTPLHVAVQSGRTELIRCLINRGADMNQANSDGNSPFDLSLSFGNCFKFYDTIKFMKRKESELRRRKSRDTEMVYGQEV